MKTRLPNAGDEDNGDRKRRARKIAGLLHRAYPDPKIALAYETPLQLLVAVILSAQCTDKRVNLVTKDLFQKYRTARDFAAASPSQFEKEIRGTGFFRAKTRSVVGCCRQLVERHGGEVPDTMEELVRLPGVGRKTANCVLGGCFGKAEGVVVDTHVKRLAARLGLTKESDPEKVEQNLMAVLDRRDWIHFANALIHHGREVCQARSPRCAECVLAGVCPSARLDSA